jgi:hypothetical protein
MRRRAACACDLARDKLADVAFVKRACRRSPTGTVSMTGKCVSEGQQVTKSVIATAPMTMPPYGGGQRACLRRVKQPR